MVRFQVSWRKAAEFAVGPSIGRENEGRWTDLNPALVICWLCDPGQVSLCASVASSVKWG